MWEAPLENAQKVQLEGANPSPNQQLSLFQLSVWYSLTHVWPFGTTNVATLAGVSISIFISWYYGRMGPSRQPRSHNDRVRRHLAVPHSNLIGGKHDLEEIQVYTRISSHPSGAFGHGHIQYCDRLDDRWPSLPHSLCLFFPAEWATYGLLTGLWVLGGD